MNKLFFDRVIDELLTPRAGKAPVRRATLFVETDYVISACLQRRPYKRARSTTIIVKSGKPNFREREFIRSCVKAKEPFPVKKVQLKFYN